MERQALWFYLPGQALASIFMFMVVLLCDQWLIGWLLPAGINREVPLALGPLLFIPVWLMVTLVITIGLFSATRRLLQPYLMWDVHIPGRRIEISFSQVQHIEVESTGEGAAMLVLNLNGQRRWAICKGGVRRLQRLGSVVSRMVGLERRDFVTWT